MDFLVGDIVRLYAKVTQKKNSGFWSFAPHIGGGVRANGKTAQKWPKKYQISKLAENPSKSEKRLVEFWNRKCNFWARESTFISPISPINVSIVFGFKCFPLMEGFSANLEIWYFFVHFWAVCPTARTPPPICGANGQNICLGGYSHKHSTYLPLGTSPEKFYISYPRSMKSPSKKPHNDVRQSSPSILK